MPSLNQLAARINLNAPTPATAGNRPRLAASLLRTSSQSSTPSSTAPSTTDSIAVNAPTSRSESPSTLSVSPPHSNGNTPVGDQPGEPLTTDKVEQLNQETATDEKKPRQKMPVGYKNIPSLDAITARLAKARTLSIDGTAKPPEAEIIEDPKPPGLMIKAPEHPLEHPWCVSLYSARFCLGC